MFKDERTFDIFRTLADGSPIWVEVVRGMDGLRQRLAELQQIHPDHYRVYDPRSGAFVDFLDKTA